MSLVQLQLHVAVTLHDYDLTTLTTRLIFSLKFLTKKLGVQTLKR